MRFKIPPWLRTRALALTAIGVLIVGFVGHLIRNFNTIDVTSSSHAAKIFFDSLLQSFQLFTLTARPDPGVDNWALVIARLGGALVAFAAIGKVILVVLSRTRLRARLAALRGHMVLCGYGERGRFFGRADQLAHVVAIDPLPNPDDAESDSQSRLLRVHGDARDPVILREAGIARADAVVIGTGSDERNLSIARSALRELDGKRGVPLDLIVTLDDPGLADSIEREDTITRPLGTPRPVAVTLFNPARAAALALLAQPRWIERALERRQRRIRLMIVGASDVAVETILQFLRVSPCVNLDRSRIDLFAPVAQARSRLLARASNLAYALDPTTSDGHANLPLRWAVDLALHEFDPAQDPIGEALERAAMAESGGDITAIVIADSASVANIQLARTLRREMERLALPPCPIHVHTPTRTSLDPLLRRAPVAAGVPIAEDLNDLAEAVDADNAMEPFGRVDALCRLRQSAAPREALARQLHAAYRARRLAAESVASKNPVSTQGAVSTQDAISARDESLQDWADLKETYRRSNRRAADHLPVKWLAANYLSQNPLSDVGFPRELTAPLLEQLAAIEHDSWRIDRELDGWRYAPRRDNARMRHPDLVPYSELPDATQEYDRAQIRELWTFRP